MDINQLPRREREKRRQRQEILAAALDLFADKGFHNVSMHQIAERAEYAVGTLYKFFQNKEELYKALVLEHCDQFDDAIVRALADSRDEVEQLRRYVQTKGQLFRAHLPFIRLYLAESRGVSFTIKAGMDEEVGKRYDALLDRLAAVFASGIERHRFRDIAEPYHLAVALDSAVNAFHLLWLDTPERHPYPEDPDAILDIFFKGLVNA